MAGACNQLIAKLRLFLGGGGVPLTLATAQPTPHAHMAVPECSLCGQAIAVSDVTPSPKGAPPLKNPGCHPGLVPGSPFHPRKRLASNAPTQPAPHEPKDRSSYASLSQTCLVNTKHLLLTEITAFGLYCPLSGQSFAVALAQTWFKSFNLVIFTGGIFLVILDVVDAFGVRGVTRS